MARRGDSLPERLGRLYVRLDRRRSADRDAERSEWRLLVQLAGIALVLVGIDAAWSAATDSLGRVAGIATRSTAALDAALPALVAVTLLAVCVCVAVVAVSLRGL